MSDLAPTKKDKNDEFYEKQRLEREKERVDRTNKMLKSLHSSTEEANK